MSDYVVSAYWFFRENEIVAHFRAETFKVIPISSLKKCDLGYQHQNYIFPLCRCDSKGIRSIS